MKRRGPKRYVLIGSEDKLSPSEVETLTRLLELRHGKLTIIQLDSPRTALVVKTDRSVAAAIRDSFADVSVGGKRVRTELTSGSIGKLKRSIRESSPRDLGEVPE